MCSGPSSLQLAKALREFLEVVVQEHEYFLYSESIKPGSLWDPKVTRTLKECPVGIACLTSDAVQSAWIHFEAGSIATAGDESRVIPYLHGVSDKDLTPPLARFTAVRSDEAGTYRLVQVLNELRASPARDEVLRRAFDGLYQAFAVSAEKVQSGPTPKHPELPDQAETLAAILQLVQGLDSKVGRLAETVSPTVGFFPTRFLDLSEKSDLDARANPAAGRAPRELLIYDTQIRPDHQGVFFRTGSSWPFVMSGSPPPSETAKPAPSPSQSPDPRPPEPKRSVPPPPIPPAPAAPTPPQTDEPGAQT